MYAWRFEWGKATFSIRKRRSCSAEWASEAKEPRCCSLLALQCDVLVIDDVGGFFKTQVTRRPATIYWIVMTRLGTPFYLITTQRACRLDGGDAATPSARCLSNNVQPINLVSSRRWREFTRHCRRWIVSHLAPIIAAPLYQNSTK